MQLETFNNLLSALFRANDLDTHWVIYTKMLKCEVISNIYTFNRMISAPWKEGKLKKESEFLETWRQ